MDKKEIHLALTGHRPERLAGYDLSALYYRCMRDYLLGVIKKYLTKYDTVVCHSGMALGADTIWAIAIVKARSIYGDRVKFHAEVPSRDQYHKWGKADQERWKYLIGVAQEVTDYFDQRKHYIQILDSRNVGMVDKCDVLITVWDRKPFGGTYKAIKYAESKGKQLLNLEPDMFY